MASEQDQALDQQVTTETTTQNPITPTDPNLQGDPNLNQVGLNPQAPTGPTLDPRVAALIQDSIAAQARRADMAERRLKEIEDAQKAPPPLTPEQQTQMFMQRPIDAVTQVVQREIQQQITPINNMMNEYIQTQQKANAIATAKAQLRANVQSFPYFAQIESQFDQAVNQLVSIDNNSIVLLYNMLVGQMFHQNPTAFQQPQTPQRQMPPQTPQQPNQTMLPAHLRPSNNPPPRNENKAPLQITEQERSLARYYKMSDEEYVAMRDADKTAFMAKPQGGK